MKIAIVQPYLFPYIGYFQLIRAVDKFVCFDDVNFIKRGWINRNKLLVNGKEHLFTIPIKAASQNKLINELELSSDTKWKQNFLKTVELNYKNAPLFDKVFPLLEHIVNFEENNLSLFIQNSFNILLPYLQITTQTVKSSSVYENRFLKGAERLVDICKKERADIYVNPIGGKEIYSKEFFSENGIQLLFLQSHNIIYPQFSGQFVPWLSIIDVMMFNPPDKISNFMNEYDFL